MSSTPRTDEAVERWRQGKVNILEEMAKLETDLNLAEAERVELAKQLQSEKEMHAACQNERDVLDDVGVCASCGYEVTPVRPGKAQCDFCDTVDKWKALADRLAAALGHSWFAAKVDQRGKLMDFLEKKKAALAAYEEANK
jgi:hypothetical protein